MAAPAPDPVPAPAADDRRDARISAIICTYNGEPWIAACLDSVLRQNHPDVEVLVVDGGSADATRTIVARYAQAHPAVRLLDNPRRLPEGFGNGKWLGYAQASGSVLAFIDQDNVLQRDDLFAAAFAQLRDRPVLGVLGGLTHDRHDPPVVRYVAMVGTDSFFAYRSLDFLLTLGPAAAGLAEHEMSRDNQSLTGGNCFFYRRQDLQSIGGYGQDVLVVRRLLDTYARVGIVPGATKHYAERNLWALMRKKFMWGKTFFVADRERFRYFPETRRERRAFAKNVAFNLTLLPNFHYALRLYRARRDPVAFLFPLFAFLNTLAYALHGLGSLAMRRSPGIPPGNPGP